MCYWLAILSVKKLRQYLPMLYVFLCWNINANVLFQGQNKLIVLLTDPLKADDTLQINVDKNGQRLEVKSIKRRNPYTLQFSMPGNFQPYNRLTFSVRHVLLSISWSLVISLIKLNTNLKIILSFWLFFKIFIF